MIPNVANALSNTTKYEYEDVNLVRKTDPLSNRDKDNK